MTNVDSEQTVTSPAYMASILKRLHSERILVSVRVGKGSSVYNSIILAVDPSHEQFTLDELNPREGHAKLHGGSPVHIDARLKGIRVMFSSEIALIEEAGNIAMYHLPLPASMIYRQRRRHHRAHIDQKQHMQISLPLPLKHFIRGELVDISASGVCSRIKYSDSPCLEQEQAILAATIDLPDQNHITCDLEVRSIRHFPDQGYSLVGSEFIGISPSTQSHVARLVAMLDRHHRRAVQY